MADHCHALVTQEGRWLYQIKIIWASQQDWIAMQEVQQWAAFGRRHAQRKAKRMVDRRNRPHETWTVI